MLILVQASPPERRGLATGLFSMGAVAALALVFPFAIIPASPLAWTRR